MNYKLKIVISVSLMLIFIKANCQADNPRGHEVGMAFSPKGCGISWDFCGNKEAISNLFVVGTDFYGVINGKHNSGCKAEYFLNYILKTKEAGDGLKISFYSGPGAIAGYLRDKDRGYGLCAGLAADVGVSFKFKTNFNITAGFTGAFAFHISRHGGNNYSVNFYKNGVLQSFFPVVSIGYTFK